MAVFHSVEKTRVETDRKAVGALLAAGAALPDGFQCVGTPQIYLDDITKGKEEPFDVGDFKGRLVFGGNMNCTDNARFPAGPVRLTVIRWGREENQCGKVVVGKTDLNGTSITSYIGVTIGDNVHLDPRVVLMDCDGHPSDRTLPDTQENRKMAPIVIEDHAWIGYGAIIMKGVTVGHHAVVAPGSVVIRDVPPHGSVVGSPAKNMNVIRGHS